MTPALLGTEFSIRTQFFAPREEPCACTPCRLPVPATADRLGGGQFDVSYIVDVTLLDAHFPVDDDFVADSPFYAEAIACVR